MKWNDMNTIQQLETLDTAIRATAKALADSSSSKEWKKNEKAIRFYFECLDSVRNELE